MVETFLPEIVKSMIIISDDVIIEQNKTFLLLLLSKHNNDQFRVYKQKSNITVAKNRIVASLRRK